MVRETPIEVYHAIKDSGVLSKARIRVLEAVYLLQSCTSGEAYSIMRSEFNGALPQSRARFTELREMGCIRENGTRSCKITGRRVIVWEPTGLFPTFNNVSAKKTNHFKKRAIVCHSRNCRESLKNGILTTDETSESYKHFVYAIKELDKILILL